MRYIVSHAIYPGNQVSVGHWHPTSQVTSPTAASTGSGEETSKLLGASSHANLDMDCRHLAEGYRRCRNRARPPRSQPFMSIRLT